MLANSVVTYDGLPVKSGGAHHLRTRDAQTAFQQMQAFFRNCALESTTPRCTVELLSGEDVGIPREWTEFMRRRFEGSYGAPGEKGLGGTVEYSWSIPATDVARQVEFLGSLGALPTHKYGMQSLCVTTQSAIQLIDSESGMPWPNQDPSSYQNFLASGYGLALGRSVVYSRISDRTTVSLFLNFPFDAGDPALRRAAAFIQENLPFKLSPSHWKRWTLSKAGNKYIARKVASPLE